MAEQVTDEKKYEHLCRMKCRELNDKEFRMFMYEAERRGLDPLMGQIWPNVRWSEEAGRKVYVGAGTGIDGLRVLAERTHQYAGQDRTEFIDDESGTPVSATARVWRFNPDLKERVSFEGTAFFAEYQQKTNKGKVTRMWAQMPHGMLAKCAEALAFRRGFPELGGLYSHDELPQGDEEPEMVHVQAWKASFMREVYAALDNLDEEIADHILSKTLGAYGLEQIDQVSTSSQANKIKATVLREAEGAGKESVEVK